MGIPGGSVVKNPPANAGDARDVGLTPRLGRSPGGGNGTPLHYSCLKNPTHRGAWQATVQQGAKSWTRTSNWACVCCGSVMSNSLQHNGLQHTRLPWLLLSPGICSNSRPMSWWCCPTISSSINSACLPDDITSLQGSYLFHSKLLFYSYCPTEMFHWDR